MRIDEIVPGYREKFAAFLANPTEELERELEAMCGGKPLGSFAYVCLWLIKNPDGKVILTESESSGLLQEGRKVLLVGQYWYRYDAGNTASTGTGKAPLADIHVFAPKDREILAMRIDGKGRHGFQGTRIPNAVAKELKRRHPEIIIPDGNILENVDQDGMLTLKELSDSQIVQTIRATLDESIKRGATSI